MQIKALRDNSHDKSMAILGNVLLYVVFYTCILLIHRRWELISDDAYRLDNVDIPYWQAFCDLWLYQYGKMVSDGLALFFIRIPYALWKVIDSFVYCAIVELISYLSGRRRIVDKVAICMLVLLFPFRWLDSAGYISTTANYIYTFTGLLIACIPLQRVVKGDKLRVRDIVFGLIGGLVACNQEQSGLSLIFFGGVVAATAYFVDKNKKGMIASGVITVAYVAEFLLFFLSPGHMIRMNSTYEMERYLPEYADWSLPYKIFRGTTATYANLMFNRCILFVLVCVLVCILGIIRKKYVCVVPALIALMIDVIDVVEFVGYFDGHFGTPDAFLPVTSKRFIAFAFTCAIMTSALLISFWQLFEGKMRIFILAVACMGVGSRIMMGLSATIYASSFRTFTLLFFCLIMISAALMKEIMSSLKDDRLDWLVALLPAASVLIR